METFNCIDVSKREIFIDHFFPNNSRQKRTLCHTRSSTSVITPCSNTCFSTPVSFWAFFPVYLCVILNFLRCFQPTKMEHSLSPVLFRLCSACTAHFMSDLQIDHLPNFLNAILHLCLFYQNNKHNSQNRKNIAFKMKHCNQNYIQHY